ncbi:MAG TPA: queuosine precursor transporter [Thermoanaerobaculaceae bacterium]|nr:queuosine precursor transporter [Thermoanaerobaculaceae bacterium]HRS15352.1 queuosine precursor transporter [Thermoanaerobaculaceae bacterium]
MTGMTRRDVLLYLLGGFFVTNAIVAELIGGKLIQAGPFIMSVGVIPWPAVFLATDLVNEYYGRPAVRWLTLLTVGLILYAFLIVFAAMLVPAASVSPVGDEPFRTVFGQSLWILAGSVTAFAVSQFVDVVVFWLVRHRTGGRMLWLRATGSTAVSQLIDTFVILGIAFWLPGKLATPDFLRLAGTNYVYKLAIAVGITPLLYAMHHAIDRYLGAEEAQRLKLGAEARSPGLAL